MEEILYIEDTDNQQIGNEIQRLCVMGDIQPPELTKQTVEFFRSTFRRLPFECMMKAFDLFLSGQTDFRKPLKINSHFLSQLMRNYISIFGHKISYKTPKLIQNTAPPITEEQKEKLNLESFELTYSHFVEAHHGGTKLIPRLMEIHGEQLLKKESVIITKKDCKEAMQWLLGYRRRRDHIENQKPKLCKIIIPVAYPDVHEVNFTACYIHFRKLLDKK
jgi:hypothetical protein